jgi:hypothetical protein
LDPSTVSVERLQCNHLIGVELVWFAITCISARCEILPHDKIGPLHADLNSRGISFRQENVKIKAGKLPSVSLNSSTELAVFAADGRLFHSRMDLEKKEFR